MQLAECMRSSTFRWTLLATGLFAAVIVALLGFVYSKTKDDLTTRSDSMIAAQLDIFAALSPEQRQNAINERLKLDPRRVQLAGLFGPDGQRIAGNVESLPPAIKIDNAIESGIVDRIDQAGRVRAVGPHDRTKSADRRRPGHWTECR